MRLTYSSTSGKRIKEDESMEFVIRVVWDVEIQRNRKDLEVLADWAMQNISNASQEAIGNKDFFPIVDRIVDYYDDNSGFRIDMSKVTAQNNEESVMKLLEVTRIILENSGANMDHVCMSYEPI